MTPETSIGTPLTTGSILAGRYRLVAPIATGGMAQVWRAYDTILGRQVAAKVLHAHLATDEAFLLRFRREAIAAARLSHRSIVAIYDTIYDPDPQPWGATEVIIMELIEGRTMRAVMDQSGPLPVGDVLEIGIQVAEALGEAHRAGIVHRDIKPSNILLCPDRRVAVTDFGIAKAGEDADLTVAGTLLGTAKYLSPEQVLGETVDPRADLYSFGIVLYEALAGQVPFLAETDATTALARLHQTPRSLREFRDDLPGELVALVERLLERDPARRYPRALDVRTALVSLPTRPAGTPLGNRIVGPPIAATSSNNSSDPTQHDVAASLSPHGVDDARDDVGNDEDRFDDEADDFDAAQPGHRTRRSRRAPATVTALLAGSLLVAALLLGQGDTDSFDEAQEQSGSSISLTPITELVTPSVAGIATVDRASLGGDESENDELLPLAFDGDDDTAWRSDTYRAPNFGRLKPGIGLLVDLGGMTRLDEVELSTNSDGWAVDLFVGEDFSGSVDSWGKPINGGQDLDGDESFDMFGTRGTHLMIWLSDHGRSADRNGDGRDDFRFELAEITVS